MPSASAEDEASSISAFVMGVRIWTNPFRILFMRDPIFRYAAFPTTPFLTQSDKEKLDRSTTRGPGISSSGATT